MATSCHKGMQNTSTIIATFELPFRLFRYNSVWTFKGKKETELELDMLLKLHQFQSYILFVAAIQVIRTYMHNFLQFKSRFS